MLLFFLSIKAQDFSIISLPENLTNNANAIIKYDEYSIDLISQDKMIIRHKAAVTIFNKKADYLAELTLFYDKGSSIKKVYMEFYDATGKRIKKVKKSDFDDYSATGSSTLYSDNRVKHYSHTAISYPYTVYYEYELNWRYTAFIPSWNPINNYNVGVEKSSYSFTYPPSFEIQKIESNFNNYSIQKKTSSGLLKYSISNLEPLKYEAMSQGLSKITPNVKIASNKFHLAGVDGVANNWQEFGKWIYDELLVSRNNLTSETVSKIKKMVKDISDPIERAKIIYEYVQNKTRYINVAVGIGGWQPMLTNDVDRLGYGDCKALTFYTKSLMDIAEVSSFYTVVYAGDYKKDIKKDVVSLQGNHVFLCLPREKDSIWLECTSQKVPFGYKNSFTDDRDVLLISPEGGKIIHTSTNKPKNNLLETTSTYTLKENGDIQGMASINSFGTQYSEHLMKFEGLSPDDLDKRMKNHFSFTNNLSFSKIEVANNKKEQRFEENITFSAENYGVINPDGSLIFNLNALNRISHIPNRERNRQTSFEISRGFKDVDVYNINIPEDYEMSQLPKPIKITSLFGIYSLSVEKKSDTSLKYKRSLLIHKGNYKKDLYEDYRSFRKKIKKLENIKIVITKI